jgi:hypothetical protein
MMNWNNDNDDYNVDVNTYDIVVDDDDDYYYYQEINVYNYNDKTLLDH